MNTAASAKPKVVLLHGVGLDKSMWAQVQDSLDYESVALDLPGHGQQPPLTTTSTLTGFGDDVVARIPEGPVHLVGFSLGALIASNIAIRFPERVTSLTCVNAVCDRTAEESVQVAVRLHAARDDFANSMSIALERWFPDDTPENQMLREKTSNVLMANDVSSYLFAYEVFATGDKELVANLPGITAPTLAITGENDPGSTPDMSYRIKKYVPNTTVEIVPGARHMLPVTHAEILAANLNQHIQQAERNA